MFKNNVYTVSLYLVQLCRCSLTATPESMGEACRLTENFLMGLGASPQQTDGQLDIMSQVCFIGLTCKPIGLGL